MRVVALVLFPSSPVDRQMQERDPGEARAAPGSSPTWASGVLLLALELSVGVRVARLVGVTARAVVAYHLGAGLLGGRALLGPRLFGGGVRSALVLNRVGIGGFGAVLRFGVR